MHRLALIAIWSVVSFGGPAVAITCPSVPEARVTVAITNNPPTTDFTRPRADLQGLPTRGPATAMGAQHQVGGLTQGNIRVDSGVQFGLMATASDRESCVWLDSIEVTVTVDAHVLIAREYQQGTCQFQAIWQHELKHVAVDRMVAQRYKPSLTGALKQAAANHRPRLSGNEAQRTRLMEAVKADLQRATDRITQAMFRERDQRQAAVDTPGEYAAVAARCPNWQ